MIIDPSPGTLIRTVSKELRTTLAPAVVDPGLKSLVLMMSAVLETAAVRADHETTWMVEEIHEIEQVARDLATSCAPESPLHASLDAYEVGIPSAVGAAAERAAYAQAGTLLSAAIDAAQNDSDHFARLERLLQERGEREAAVVGGVALVGRS